MFVTVQSYTGLLNLIELGGGFIPAFLYNNQVLTLTYLQHDKRLGHTLQMHVLMLISIFHLCISLIAFCKRVEVCTLITCKD